MTHRQIVLPQIVLQRIVRKPAAPDFYRDSRPYRFLEKNPHHQIQVIRVIAATINCISREMPVLRGEQ